MLSPPRRILIVDDSPTDRKIYRRFLEGQSRFKIEVTEAATAAAALKACEATDPECVLLDYRLPDGNGLELMSQLREYSSAPVLFLTGQPEALLMTEAYRNGAMLYLSKDFLSSDTLISKVIELLEARDRETELL